MQTNSPDDIALSAAINEIWALTSPENVESSEFAHIQLALQDALILSGESKFSSRVPLGAQNKVEDLAVVNVEGTFQLEWRYKNIGDYNQDGRVDIQDVRPLALHFRHTSEALGGTSTDELDIVIDGNMDVVINIQDVQPLAVNFFSKVTGYVIEVSSDEALSWQEVTRIPITSSFDKEGSGWKAFSYELTEPVEMGIYRVRPYSAENEYGDESKLVRFFTTPLSLRVDRQATPPLGGTGTNEDPLVVEVSSTYNLIVEDPLGNDVSADVFFENFPPAFLTFSAAVPRALTVDNALAGDFWIIAKKGAVAPIESNKLYFRVRQELPQ